MKLAYFDCYSGVSGDMIVGAFIDAGLPLQVLEKGLASLLLKSYEIEVKKVQKNTLSATQVLFHCKDEHHERSLADIQIIITRSTLPSPVKHMSLEVFNRLAKAEAQVHGVSVDKIHFHEIGACDSILDIVGSCIGFHALGIEKALSSPLPLGSGITRSRHGMIPVPAPATLALLTGVPVYQNSVQAELTTPTGAALLTTFSEYFGEIPPMKIECIGYGAGQQDLILPNVLRVLIGTGQSDFFSELLDIIETNIDDLSPEIYESVMEKLMKSGAYDVFLTPIQMKKSRPAVKLTVLCSPSITNEILSVLFQETTAIGLRIVQSKKIMTHREIRTVESSLGPLRIKFTTMAGKIIHLKPEYEDCKKISEKANLPLLQVYSILSAEIPSLL